MQGVKVVERDAYLVGPWSSKPCPVVCQFQQSLPPFQQSPTLYPTTKPIISDGHTFCRIFQNGHIETTTLHLPNAYGFLEMGQHLVCCLYDAHHIVSLDLQSLALQAAISVLQAPAILLPLAQDSLILFGGWDEGWGMVTSKTLDPIERFSLPVVPIYACQIPDGFAIVGIRHGKIALALINVHGHIQKIIRLDFLPLGIYAVETSLYLPHTDGQSRFDLLSYKKMQCISSLSPCVFCHDQDHTIYLDTKKGKVFGLIAQNPLPAFGYGTLLE